jgi:sugar phosphate permease
MKPAQQRFYGWYIVGVCFVISLFVGGLIGNAPIRILNVVTADLNWHNVTTDPFPMSMLAASFLPLLVGWLVDRRGSRELMLIGCLLSGMSIASFVVISNLWHFALLNILALGGVAAAAGIPADLLLLRWFKRNRGLAIGLTAAGAIIGGGLIERLVESPFKEGHYLLGSIDWRTPAIAIGAISLCLTIPLILMCVKDRPSEMGLQPQGIESDEELAAEPPGHTLKEACRTRSFWLIAGGLLLAQAALMPIEVYGMKYLTDEAQHASDTVAMLDNVGVVLAVPCIILLGWVADKWDARRAFVLAIGFVTVGILFFTTSSHLFAAGLFLLIYGVSSRCLFVVYPIIIADSHGLHRFGIISAVVGLIVSIGGTAAFLPLSLLLFKDKSDSSPSFLFLILIPIALLSAYCIYKAKPLPPAETVVEST